MAKTGIHPKYFESKVICTTCSSEFLSGSTKNGELKVDTCSSCHPFYTGNQNYSNAAGRVERFKSKFAKQEELKKTVDQKSKEQKELNKAAKAKKEKIQNNQ